MGGFHLYASNRLEILADRLASVLQRPLRSALQPEVIVVQSKGMERWLSHRLAEHFSVWANCRYPFPRAMIRTLFSAVVKQSEASDGFERETIAFRVMDCLSAGADRPEFSAIRRYLGDKPDQQKVYQLAVRIAEAFDGYIVFRPEMILAWERGEQNHWQAELWRAIAGKAVLDHAARQREQFVDALRSGQMSASQRLPERISVFGISYLPPFYLEVLSVAAQYCEVHLCLLVVSRRFVDGEGPNLSRLEEAHDLLVSMGKTNRDFAETVLRHRPCIHSCFASPILDTLLHHLQANLLHDCDAGLPDRLRRVLPELDSSIGIHSCHSPLREVEVLYDFLLNAFTEKAELRPRDVIVMTPQIETYAPFIEAVFSLAEQENYIPYTIIDRSIRRERSMVMTLLAVLELAASRFEASKVVDILMCEEVQRRFALGAADVDLVRKWVDKTHICWGVDAEDRAASGQPKVNQNTWRAGIERLLLGYALPPHEDRLFMDMLPYDDIEGSQTGVLGRAIDYFETLAELVRALRQPKRLSDWQQTLDDMVSRLFLPAEDVEQESQAIRSNLLRLSILQQEAHFFQPVDLEVITSWLEKAFERELSGERRFITGQVTFCAMLPMRSIPYKVICLLGLNSADFPRSSGAVGFDLVADRPQLGDRSLRDEDRYLFLETIVSARDSLYISYVGQSASDNSQIPPSVLVSDLMDHIERSFEVPGAPIRDRIFKKHSLQAFSPRYFDPSGPLYSYSRRNLMACMSARSAQEEAKPLLVGQLPQGEEPMPVVLLEELVAFFDNPAQYLLVNELNLKVPGGVQTILDHEPFDLIGLDRYRLEQQLCERMLGGHDVQGMYDLVRAEGILPHGRFGALKYQDAFTDVQQFAQHVSAYMTGEALPKQTVSVELLRGVLEAELADLWPAHMLCMRCGKLRAKDRLRAWIRHLVLNCADNATLPRQTLLVGKEECWRFGPANGSRGLLEILVALYERGKRELLPFFPETSHEYVRNTLAGASRELALSRAEAHWSGGAMKRGEGQDAYYRYCYERANPLGTDFEQVSRAVFVPLFEHQERQLA